MSKCYRKIIKALMKKVQIAPMIMAIAVTLLHSLLLLNKKYYRDCLHIVIKYYCNGPHIGNHSLESGQSMSIHRLPPITSITWISDFKFGFLLPYRNAI